MTVKTQLADSIANTIDASAKVQGLTRSAWLRAAIIAKLDAEAVTPPPAPHAPKGARRLVQFRIETPTLARLDNEASAFGMRRSQWILNHVRGRLWRAQGEPVLAPRTGDALLQINAQLLRIGRNVNQAVHAINAAAMPESGLDIIRCAAQLVELRGDLWVAIDHIEPSLLSLSAAERAYWRGE